MTTAQQLDTGMDLRDLLTDEAFHQRPSMAARADRRFEALHSLATVFADSPASVLQRLVEIAVEFCGADSAGISLEEPENPTGPRFRWIAVAGSFERYLEGTTPRHYSPCGTCLDLNRPQLYRLGEPYYQFLGVTADAITDGILIPWHTEDHSGTVWAVAHGSPETFNLEDYKLLNSLADFAAIAIRHQQQEQALRQQASDTASAARAHDLAHRINNPLQSLTNAIYLASQPGLADHYLPEAARELERVTSQVNLILNARAKENQA